MPDDLPQDEPRRPQFGLRALLLLMLIASVLAAILGGLLQGGARRQIFILLGIAAPVGLMILLGLFDALRQLWNRRRQDQ